MDQKQRFVLMRLLAGIWLVGYAVTFLGLFVIIGTMFAGATPQQVSPYMFALLAFSLPAEIAIHILSAWRRCARCRERLFPLIAGGISMIGKIPDRPDFRAETVLGSYHLGAVVGMAAKGAVVCVHCGLKDGVAPDYVVTAQR